MMRPFTSTITIEEARKRLAANVRPIDRIERVSLADAAGRVAATDIVSSIDVPPFRRAAMDGYAVIAAEIAGASFQQPSRLRIVERIHAGKLPSERVGSNGCAEIATGGAVPDG